MCVVLVGDGFPYCVHFSANSFVPNAAKLTVVSVPSSSSASKLVAPTYWREPSVLVRHRLNVCLSCACGAKPLAHKQSMIPASRISNTYFCLPSCGKKLTPSGFKCSDKFSHAFHLTGARFRLRGIKIAQHIEATIAGVSVLKLQIPDLGCGTRPRGFKEKTRLMIDFGRGPWQIHAVIIGIVVINHVRVLVVIGVVLKDRQLQRSIYNIGNSLVGRN